jgi:diguanylate cyclase (GGDEF)-like protein
MTILGLRLFTKPVSLTRLALYFLAGVGVLLLLIGALFFTDLSRLEHHIAQTNKQLAQQELVQVLALLEHQTQLTGAKIADWDEARLQIADPAYYALWRNSRAMTAGILPATTDGLELYDLSGKGFSREPVAGVAGMPVKIHKSDLRVWYRKDHGHDHLYYFFPVYIDSTQHQLIGFGGLKLNFLDELKSLRRFRYADMASIRVGINDDKFHPLNGVASAMIYQTLPTQEITEFKALIFRLIYSVTAIVGVGALLAYLFVVALVVRPLRRLSNHIDVIRAGRSGLLSESYRGPVPVSELENVRLSLNEHQSRLEKMHLHLTSKNDELWKLAHHDPLTGIYNRRSFEEDWGDLMAASAAGPINASFLLFDCDHFKPINDTYGHPVGDSVIQGIVAALHSALRVGDRLYRMGGDEFATLLHETDTDTTQVVAERCINSVNEHDFTALGIKEPVRISIGIAHSHDAVSAELLHAHADMAMYLAKRPGNQKIVVFSAEMTTEVSSVLSSAETAAVYAAINSTEMLEMHYQKIVNLSDSRTDYFEALVRIRSGDKLIFPGGIFPVVDAHRLETEFDMAVLNRIHLDIGAGIIPPGTGVSINVSGVSIITQHITDKLLSFAKFLDRYKLVVEITETALITHINHASSNLNQLRKAGFTIALDDFGSGYSSFRYLSSMPVDVVKFDISLVQSLGEGGRQGIIVENLARLIHDAGFKLVAEGIETQATLELVTSLGFNYAQGYYLGRPAKLG